MPSHKELIEQLKALRATMEKSADMLEAVYPDSGHVAELRGAAKTLESWIDGIVQDMRKAA
jgi:uncharacterized protein Yka (UPF0111/DUF47 family)